MENRVLVLADPPKDTTAGGLVIPDTAVRQTKGFTGTVIAVGEVPKRAASGSGPFTCKLMPGDRVLFHNCTEVHQDGGDRYVMLFVQEVLARLHGEGSPMEERPVSITASN